MSGEAFMMMLAATVAFSPDPAAAEITCSARQPRSVAGLSPEEACAIVRQQVLASRSRARHAAVAIEIDLSRAGSAIARVRRGDRFLPEIAVDVMDRSLRREDLVRLGNAVARALSTDSQM